MGIRQIHIAKADGAAITQIAANSWSHKLGDRAGKILCRNHGHIVGAGNRHIDLFGHNAAVLIIQCNCKTLDFSLPCCQVFNSRIGHRVRPSQLTAGARASGITIQHRSQRPQWCTHRRAASRY